MFQTFVFLSPLFCDFFTMGAFHILKPSRGVLAQAPNVGGTIRSIRSPHLLSFVRDTSCQRKPQVDHGSCYDGDSCGCLHGCRCNCICWSCIRWRCCEHCRPEISLMEEIQGKWVNLCVGFPYRGHCRCRCYACRPCCSYYCGGSCYCGCCSSSSCCCCCWWCWLPLPFQCLRSLRKPGRPGLAITGAIGGINLAIAAPMESKPSSQVRTPASPRGWFRPGRVWCCG